MKTLIKSLLLLSCMCICACSSLNNNIDNKETPIDNTPLFKQDLNSGKCEVYTFTSYGSTAYYHLLETYDAPLTLSSYNSYFTINKDNITTYYSIPMFQYTFSV